MFYLTLSQSTKKLLLLVLSALFAYWLLFAPATCSASGTYQISEQELIQLEANLTQLEQLSKTQQAELARLRTQLQRSHTELQLLKNQLSTSSAQLTIAQQSLQNANLSLQRYATEEKKKRLKVKAQRNAWAVASILFVGIAVVK